MIYYNASLANFLAKEGVPYDAGPSKGSNQVSAQDISNFVAANINNPQAIANAAAQYGVSASDIASATGYTPEQQSSYFQSSNVIPTYSGLDALSSRKQDKLDKFTDIIQSGGALTKSQEADLGRFSSIVGRDLAAELNYTPITQKYEYKSGLPGYDISTASQNQQTITTKNIQDYLAANPGMSDAQIAAAMNQFNVTPEQMAAASNLPLDVVQARYSSAFPDLVTEAYQNILGKNPDAEGLAFWSSQLQSGNIKIDDFANQFVTAAKNADPANAAAYDRNAYLYSDPTVRAHGKDYDVNTILHLASQIVPNIGEFRGGIFGTKGESVGFSFNEARQILGRDPNPGEQVVLDMARGLMNRGITDLSQLKIEDILAEGSVSEVFDEGAQTGRYRVSAYNPYGDEGGSSVNRELTPEELTRVQSRQIRDEEGNLITQYYLPDVSVGKIVKSPDQILGYSSATDPFRLGIGETYSGPGMTGYNMIVNPTTGKIQFSTYGEDTGQGQMISAALTMASFVPGLQPFALAANAAIAISQGNYLGAIASVAGMGGYTNIATAANVANAIQNNNPMGVVTALVNNPTISSSVSNINLAGNITLSDVARTANLVSAVDRGDWASVAQIGGQLINSTDLQTAAAAARVVQAASDGNFTAALNATQGLQRTLDAANNINNQDVASRVVEVVNRDVTSGADSTTLRDVIVDTAVNNGASLTDAIDAAEAIANVQDAVTLVSDEGEDLSTNLQTEINRSLETVDLGEFAGLDDAITRTIESRTLNISNTEADTPEEAAALAGARGFTAFNYGGQTYQVSASAATIAQQVAEQEIASQDTFANAYQTARAQLGPGQIFTWNGNQYSTDTREENPSLAAASDQLRAASMGVANGKGTYAGYDEKAVDTALSQMGTFDSFLNATTEDGQKIVVGDQISKDLITPLVRIFGLTTRATGELAESMAGSLMAMNVIDKDSPIVRAATQLKNSSAHAVGSDIAQAEKNVFERVSKADGAFNKGVELFKAMWDNPITMFTLPFNEGVQEIAPLLAGVGAAKWLGTIAGLTTSAGLNAAEAAGANYNETVAMAEQAGMSPADAHAAGQRSALAAGTVAAVLGPVAELPFIKRAAGDAAGSAVGTTVSRALTAAGREAVTEYPEEAIASLAADYFATGAIDLNKALTQGTIASVTAGKTVGAYSVITDVMADRPATDQIISSAAVTNSQRPVVDQTITVALQNNQNLADAGSQISSSLIDSGISEDQANNIANTVVAEQFVNNIKSDGTQFNIENLNQAVGVDANGNAVTVGDVIGSAITNKGVETFITPDIVIGTNANGGVMTIGDLSTVNRSTTSTVSDARVESDTTQQGDVTTTTNTDANTGATTTIETNTQTNVTTETTANVDTQTTTVTDPNANTATRTEVNTETNTQVTTTNDANTNTVTQTTVDPNTNTNTEVTVNTDTNTTTQVTTDNNTNTQTTVHTDTVNNTQITTVVDGNTGEIIDETVTSVPEGWTPPTIDAPPVNPPTTTTTTTTNPRVQTPRRLPQLGGLGALTQPEVISDDDLTFKDPFISSLVGQERFKGSLDPFLAQVESDRLGQEFEQVKQQNMRGGEEMMNYFTYGVPTDIDQVFNPVPKSFRDMVPENDEGPTLMAAARGGLATPLMAAGGYAGGGLPVVAHSGKARVDFRQGAAVSGPGDGQSDDIPAMLADGEFVFPADVVAALGNGSTKAGSDKLYDMMHSIRAHHRSAKPQDLPPPAKKNPLDYLKKARR